MTKAELEATKAKFFAENDWQHCGMGCGRCVEAHRALRDAVAEVERLQAEIATEGYTS